MIRVRDLTQIYPSGKGIFDVSFTVEEGEVFGYLGPNGAGKTTTIRHMLGFANADTGHVTIDGLDCRRDANKLQLHIGYIPGEMNFVNRMSGLEFLTFMEGMRGTKDTSRRKALIRRFDLEADGKIRKMSKGMKQKLGIVAAFMHDPKIYILDEPSAGLDPLMQKVFMELLEEEKARGKTILMSSHILEEVQHSCHRAGIIRDGRLVAVEGIESLEAMAGGGFEVVLRNDIDVQRLLDSVFESVAKSAKTVEVKVMYPYKTFFEFLSHCDVVSILPLKTSLEDVFMKYYGEVGGWND